MRHHLQIIGSVETTARCSCGEWKKTDPSWEYLDGYDVRYRVWSDFKAHVMEHEPDFVEAYNLSGWYPTIPYNDRTTSNLSDGAIFSTVLLAKEWADSKRMHIFRIERIMLRGNDPQIDFFLQDMGEQDRRLGMVREVVV